MENVFAILSSVRFLNGSVDPRLSTGRIIQYGDGYILIRPVRALDGYGYAFDPTRISWVGYGSQPLDPRLTADNRKMGQNRTFLDNLDKNVLSTVMFDLTNFKMFEV